MKALQKYGFDDGDVEIREVPAPEVHPDTVLIKAVAVGVCGSDIHMWRNGQSWEVKTPVTLGHETAGVIEAVGENVRGWEVGERVVCETAAYICKECPYCRAGQYNICPNRQGYGAIRDGAFAEYLEAEPRILHRIPEGVSFEVAAMTEPGAVAYNAMVERARVFPGDLVVVQGPGAIGAFCVQMARLSGAAQVVVVGTKKDREKMSKLLSLGADYAVEVEEEDPREVVKGLNDGYGAHVVVDATGVSSAFQTSMDLVRPGGSIVKVGWGPQPLDFNLDPIVAKAATLYGSFSHTWETWERILRLFAAGRLQPEALLGGVYPLADWQVAFEAMDSGKNIKSVISME